MNWEPVKTIEDGFDVLLFARSGDDSGGYVLYSLEFVNLSVEDPPKVHYMCQAGM